MSDLFHADGGFGLEFRIEITRNKIIVDILFNELLISRQFIDLFHANGGFGFQVRD